MTDFLLVFRRDYVTEQTKLTPEQTQAMMTPWQEWIEKIAGQGKLVSQGNRLTAKGKVVKPGNVITDGPYVELKEGIGGYIMVKAETLDEATALTAGCPIFHVGGSVEVRPVVPM